MRLAFVIGCAGIALAACVGEGTEGRRVEEGAPTAAQGGNATGSGGDPASGFGGDTGGPAGSGAAGGVGGGTGSARTGKPDGGAGGSSGSDGGLDNLDPTFTHHLIAQGHQGGCVIAHDGTLECWDFLGLALESPYPGTFSAIYGGPFQESSRCFLSTDGSYRCDGGAATPLDDFPVIDMAFAHLDACGLRPDQSIICWENYHTISTSELPVPGGAFTAIESTEADSTSGTQAFCALRVDGSGECWNDPDGEYTFPVDQRFTQFSLGVRMGCGVTTAGAVLCWGPVADQIPPSDLPTSGAHSVQLSFGGGCALMHDGALECFYAVPDPETLPPALRFRELAGGDSDTCGIATDDTVWCWSNGFGTQRLDQAGNPLLAERP